VLVTSNLLSLTLLAHIFLSSSQQPKLSTMMATATTDKLSYIGKAVITELETNHQQYHKKLWALASGTMVGDIQHGPRGCWKQQRERDAHDPDDGHTNWLPETMAGLLAKTEIFCDFTSLAPPDGYFMETIKEALATVAARSKETGNKIIVRFMFANVITVPCDCNAILKEFTNGIPTDTNLQIWVGSWRKGMCWNHAKIVAVDGKYLYTGGHNLWDPVYLRKDPIHDTSIQLEGNVALEGHNFANELWSFVAKEESSVMGWLVDKLPDSSFVPTMTRVTISAWPNEAPTFAPTFKEEMVVVVKTQDKSDSSNTVPIIALGRYGNIVEKGRSSDKAFIAMFDAAQTSLRFLLQDLGPVNKTVAGVKISYRGWPKEYMKAMGCAMWERGVDIEIVLSNPGSGEKRGNYSNGWSCAEVAAEIIKAMQEEHPEVMEVDIRKKVADNLRVCFLKIGSGNAWKDGSKIGLHSKLFIVDDVCTYVGSQNLYQFDLAEWGVVIDSQERTAAIMESLWTPMWTDSYGDGSDCHVDEVMEALKLDRDPHETTDVLADYEIAKMEANINLSELKKSNLYRDEAVSGCVVS
jgi:hypothetical protein